jgi:hypothetical protein
MTAPFALEPSPPDPQPVRVYKLDDCTWWAGYSLSAEPAVGADGQSDRPHRCARGPLH